MMQMKKTVRRITARILLALALLIAGTGALVFLFPGDFPWWFLLLAALNLTVFSVSAVRIYRRYTRDHPREVSPNDQPTT